MTGQYKKSKINKGKKIDFSHRNKRLKYLKTRRNLRQAQILLSRCRILLRMLATVVLFWCIYKFALLPGWFVSPTAFLFYPNYSLILEGNTITNNKQVLSALRKVEFPRKPIYLMNTDDFEEALFKLDPIKKVYIRRFAFPGRLKIVLDEKVPILSISPSPQVDPIAVFANDSSIIGRDYLPLKEDNTYKIITYDDYTQWTSKQVEYLAKLCKTIEVYSEKQLNYIDIRNPDDVIVQLDDLKLRIGALNDAVLMRVTKISSIIPKVEAMKGQIRIDYIDLRWNKAAYIKTK